MGKSHSTLLNKTIIIVETDQAVLDLLTIILTEEDYNIKGTIKFAEVKPLMVKEKPDLVVIEYKLNGFEAIELCRQIKNEYPTILVAAISCNGDIGSKYKTSGFDAFLSKPFDIDVLVNTVNAMFK